MLDFILLAIGIVGFGLAGYWDLKTTEFPDWLPYSMIILALLFRGIFGFLENNWWILGDSVFVGVVFLSLGLLLYFLKQWGDGDAWLLGALGFLFPTSSFQINTFFPLPLAILFNFLLISLVYLITYSIYLGIKNREINKRYIDFIMKQRNKFIILASVFFVVSWGSAILMYMLFSLEITKLIQIIILPFILNFILFFSYYAKIVEKDLFKRKIKTSELKEGDVILEGKWRGLTKTEIKQIKKKYKYVWIKEGVRFAPVFIITMLISIIYGDLMFLFI